MTLNKKHILFINGHLRSGGVERTLVSLLKNVDYSRFDITLLLTEEGDEYLGEIPSEVRIIQKPLEECFGCVKSLLMSARKSKQDRFNLKFRLAWKFSPYIGNWILRDCGNELGIGETYDAAVAFRPGFSTKLASIVKCGKKIAWWHHGNITESIEAQKQMVASWHTFDYVVTVSEGMAEQLREMSVGLAPKVRVLNNIVDAGDIIEKGDESDTNYSTDVFQIVSVSRLVIEKRFEIIPEVAAILKARRIQFQWHIIGEGPRRPLIEEAIVANGVEESIILHGNKTNPYPWIKNADLMVHVSPVESFGLVLTEAMVLGTPCIAVESAGSREIIDQNNGIRVKFSAEAIAEAIINVMNKPERLNEIRGAALKSVKRYSPEGVMPQLYALWG